MDFRTASSLAGEIEIAGKSLGLEAQVVNGSEWDTYAVLVTDREGYFDHGFSSNQYVVANDHDRELMLSSITTTIDNLEIA